MSQLAKEVWLSYFGNKEQGKDFAGRLIRFSDYGNTKSNTGWTIDHIVPQSQVINNQLSNLIPVHYLTNSDKANKNTFTTNGSLYQVKKDKASKSHKIVKLMTKQ